MKSKYNFVDGILFTIWIVFLWQAVSQKNWELVIWQIITIWMWYCAIDNRQDNRILRADLEEVYKQSSENNKKAFGLSMDVKNREVRIAELEEVLRTKPKKQIKK